MDFDEQLQISKKDLQTLEKWSTARKAAKEELIGKKELNLEYLNLENIPSSIVNLKNLETLLLKSNQLTTFPASILYLKKLKKIDLSNNLLTSIPIEIAGLVNLEELNISHNPDLEIPDFLFGLENLKKINIAGCDLTEIVNNATEEEYEFPEDSYEEEIENMYSDKKSKFDKRFYPTTHRISKKVSDVLVKQEPTRTQNPLSTIDFELEDEDEDISSLKSLEKSKSSDKVVTPLIDFELENEDEDIIEDISSLKKLEKSKSSDKVVPSLIEEDEDEDIIEDIPSLSTDKVKSSSVKSLSDTSLEEEIQKELLINEMNEVDTREGAVKSLSDEDIIEDTSLSDTSLEEEEEPIPFEPTPTKRELPERELPETNYKVRMIKEIAPYCESMGNMFDEKCNQIKLIKEETEAQMLEANPNSHPYLYPNLNDPNFTLKISEKKEFADTKYDGKIYDIKEHSDELMNVPFELSPHQAFVRNFMSFQTPYNSLLLFHGLGTGKTCSAIGVCEEMRDYFKQIGINKKIIIVASPNVQDNFRLQLFDERKLKYVDGIWTTKGCIGNKLIKEVNPTNMKGLTKDKLVYLVNNLIRSWYKFMGYIQFGNEINKITNVSSNLHTEEDISKEKMRLLQNEFNDRLLVIDEVHNLRITDDNDNKDASKNLMYMVSVVNNLRLLLLSATPMFNTYKEIIWLINLMNMNDKRGYVSERDIFDKEGNFRVKNDKEVGKELLIRKITGYVSFVRGENPYIFPFRVYPNTFAPEHTFTDVAQYPKFQLNGKIIPDDQKIQKLSLYLLKIGSYQKYGYYYLLERIRSKKSEKSATAYEELEGFGYSDLQLPIEALNIVYPVLGLNRMEIPKIREVDMDELPELKVEEEGDVEDVEIEDILESGPEVIHVATGEEGDEIEEEEIELEGGSKTSSNSNQEYLVNYREITGTEGLQNFMNYTDTRVPNVKGDFSYKNTGFGNIFARNEIGKYSSKIKNICDSIMSPEGELSEGIILVYSNYIDAGLIPVALSLEEMGFTRHGRNPLFKDSPTRPIKGLAYTMITGDTRLSPDNDATVKAMTNEDNLNGEKIKVVLVSQAGAEGLDFKAIRQIHILEPWYNMSHIEQIIGRGVRNLSHKSLPFEKRNVQIFMYGTILDRNEEESADLYVYRVAEQKANKIGELTRLIKQCAVDCLINQEQTNFTQENFADQKVTQVLSTGQKITNFPVGDVPFSAVCDYMSKCDYKCIPNEIVEEDKENLYSYDKTFMLVNSDKIIQKIKNLMQIRFFYKKRELLNYLNFPKKYPTIQIYAALTELINDPTEFIVDKYGRTGRLVNIGDYYLFQPSELTYPNASIFSRSVPIEYKPNSITIDVSRDISEAVIDKRDLDEDIDLEEEIELDADIDLEEEINLEGNVNKKTTVKPKRIIPNTGKGIKILNEMRVNYATAINTTQVSKGESDWYKFCGIVMKDMIENDTSIDEELLKECLIKHIVDTLMFNDKVELINYFNIDWSNEITDDIEDDFEMEIVDYFKSKIVRTTKRTAMILYDGTNRINDIRLMMLNKDGKWMLGDKEDFQTLVEGISEKLKSDIPLSHLVGFIGYENKKQYMVYKIKETLKKRHIGSRCDQAGKIKTIKTLNEIEGYEKYNKENTKQMVQPELCVLSEFTLRIYDTELKDNKRWFFTPEEAVFNFDEK